jgi:hypothetical protein
VSHVSSRIRARPFAATLGRVVESLSARDSSRFGSLCIWAVVREVVAYELRTDLMTRIDTKTPR